MNESRFKRERITSINAESGPKVLSPVQKKK